MWKNIWGYDIMSDNPYQSVDPIIDLLGLGNKRDEWRDKLVKLATNRLDDPLQVLGELTQVAQEQLKSINDPEKEQQLLNVIMGFQEQIIKLKNDKLKDYEATVRELKLTRELTEAEKQQLYAEQEKVIREHEEELARKRREILEDERYERQQAEAKRRGNEKRPYSEYLVDSNRQLDGIIRMTNQRLVELEQMVQPERE